MAKHTRESRRHHHRRNLLLGTAAQRWVHSHGRATSHHLPTDSFSSCKPESVPSFKCLKSLTPISWEPHSSVSVNLTAWLSSLRNVSAPVAASSTWHTILELSSRGAAVPFFSKGQHRLQSAGYQNFFLQKNTKLSREVRGGMGLRGIGDGSDQNTLYRILEASIKVFSLEYMLWKKI